MKFVDVCNRLGFFLQEPETSISLTRRSVLSTSVLVPLKNPFIAKILQFLFRRITLHYGPGETVCSSYGVRPQYIVVSFFSSKR